jgi:hypothetical protein
MDSKDFHEAARDRLRWMLYNNRFKQGWIVATGKTEDPYTREWDQLHTANGTILDCLDELAELFYGPLRTDA